MAMAVRGVVSRYQCLPDSMQAEAANVVRGRVVQDLHKGADDGPPRRAGRMRHGVERKRGREMFGDAGDGRVTRRAASKQLLAAPTGLVASPTRAHPQTRCA